MAYKIRIKQETPISARLSYQLRYKSLKDIEENVKKGTYMGDFIVVAGVPYQMVEYSMESFGKGSRWVTYYNPYTDNQIYIDYAEGTVDFGKTFIDWKKDFPLDMEYLKKRFK